MKIFPYPTQQLEQGKCWYLFMKISACSCKQQNSRWFEKPGGMTRIGSALQIVMRIGEAKYPETRDRQSWSLLSCHGAGPGKKNVIAPTKHKMMAFKAQSLQPGTCLPAGTLATRERIPALPTSLYLWLPILSGMTESDSWRLVYDLTSSLQKRLEKQRYGSFHF